MGNPLPNVLIGGAVCAAITGYTRTMVFLFIIAVATAGFHNFHSNKMWGKIISALTKKH